MDGVLFNVSKYNEFGEKVAVSIWNAVFDELGIYQEHERLKKLFISGKFPSYMEWTDEACKVLQKYGLTKEKFIGIINKRPLMRGAEETFAELKSKGYKTAVITGSFKTLALRAKKLLGIDYIIAHCELIFNKQGNLERWKLTPCDFDGKTTYLKKIAGQLNLEPFQCAYVGDEVNDIPIFKEV